MEQLYKKIRAQADLLDAAIADELKQTATDLDPDGVKMLVDAEFTIIHILTRMLPQPRTYNLPNGIDPESPEGQALIEKYEWEQMNQTGGAL